MHAWNVDSTWAFVLRPGAKAASTVVVPRTTPQLASVCSATAAPSLQSGRSASRPIASWTQAAPRPRAGGAGRRPNPPTSSSLSASPAQCQAVTFPAQRRPTPSVGKDLECGARQLRLAHKRVCVSQRARERQADSRRDIVPQRHPLQGSNIEQSVSTAGRYRQSDIAGEEQSDSITAS